MTITLFLLLLVFFSLFVYVLFLINASTLPTIKSSSLSVNMDFEIIPFEKVGPIEFNLSIKEIKEKLAKSEYLEDTNGFGITLVYNEIGTGFYFKDGVCVSIVCYKPATPTYRSLNLLTLRYKEIFKIFGESEIYTDPQGILILKYGIEFQFLETDSDDLPEAIHISTQEYCMNLLTEYERYE